MTAYLPVLPALLLLGLLGWIRHRLIVTEVHGPSMLPTYRDGDRLLTRRAGRSPLRPGQVVVLRNPRPAGVPGSSTGPLLVKRVAAVAGDRLPPDMPDLPPDLPDGRVPAGHLVVLGDNRAQSLDSRQLGPIPVGNIVGTVVRRMAVPTRRRSLDRADGCVD